MAVCTNKTEHLAIDLLKKIGIYDYFEYVAGHNTFNYCKPDPRHLTNTIEILDGDINKSLMSDFKSKMKSNVLNTKELELEIDDFKSIIVKTELPIKKTIKS